METILTVTCVLKTRLRTLAVGIAVVICVSATADSAWAKQCQWTGGGAPDNTWSNPANWVGCDSAPGVRGIPQNYDDLLFRDGAAQTTNVNDIDGLSVHGVLIVGRGAGPAFEHWNITGDPLHPLTVTGSITAESPADPAGNGPSFLVPITVGEPETLPIDNGGPFDVDLAPLVLGDIDLAGSAVVFDLRFPVIVAGHISGAGGPFRAAVFKLGSSSLTLNDNSYTGLTGVGRGTIVAASAHALGAQGDDLDDTFVNPDAVLMLSDGVVTDEVIRLDGSARIVVAPGAAATMAGGLVPGSSGAFDVGGTLTISGPLVGDPALPLAATGIGTVILSNPNNALSGFIVKAGTLRAGAPGAISSGTDLTLSTGAEPAILDLNNVDVTIRSLSGDEGGRILLGSHTLTINHGRTPGGPNSISYSGTIAGTGNLVKAGQGTALALAGSQANTYTGTTTVQAGTLETKKTIRNATIVGPLVINGGALLNNGDGDQIADSAPVTVNAPGAFRFNAGSEAIGSLAGNGSVSVSSERLTVGANNTSTRFEGTITGLRLGPGLPPEVYLRLVKVGTGTLTLTGNSDLGNQAAVDAGTLALDGQLNTSDVLVRGGTLAGTGTVLSTDGATTLVSHVVVNGAISPGPSSGLTQGHTPGILHADAVVLAGGSTFAVDINGAAPGTGYDQLDLTNTLTLDAGAQLVVTRTFVAPTNSQFTIVNLAAGKSVTGTFAGLPEGATLTIDGQKFSITYQGGAAHNSVVLTALVDAPLPTYFLSEGATGGFFDEDLLIANPNDAAAPVTLTFSKENGEQVVTTRTVPAQAHLTVHVDQIPGLEATSASAQVTSDARLPLVVERSMFWDATYYAGHTGSAVDQPAPDWFFAEGSQGFFETFVLVINPNATPTEVTFTFFRENEAPVVKTTTVGATTRLTLHAADLPELLGRSFGIAVHATQPIMAERSMYFGSPDHGLSGGTESAGVTAPSTHWFLAEGATGGFFYTFVLLSNPQPTEAHVTLTYLLDTGDTVTVQKVLPANTRLTTNVGGEDDPRLHNAAVATVVTADQPIIAERSMYWAALPWREGHNSFGVVDAGTSWGLSEGRIGGPLNFHTYILLANPQTTAAQVTVNYLRETGAPVTKTYTVAPTSRFNIDTNSITELHDESFGAVIRVTNGVNIIVERSMYWDSNGVSFSGGTNATGIRLP